MPNQPVALVTGASRGIGRGVAAALLEAGYRVYATGRSIADTPSEDFRPIRCDHRDDVQTYGVFEAIDASAGRLDLLVNAAWGGYERMVEVGGWTWNDPFWQQPMHRWSSMMDAGLRATFVCSAMAARVMVGARHGLIVNLSYWAAQKHLGNAIYGMAKAATDKLAADMAIELAPFGVSAIAVYPGLVRTEAVLEAARVGAIDLTNSESPQFVGRVIAALAAQPSLPEHSGKRIVAAELARELGIRDIDGTCPSPLTIDTA